jgi:hypothetical protein
LEKGARPGWFDGDQSRNGDAVSLDEERLATVADAAEDIAELPGESRRGNDLIHKSVLYSIT